MAIGEATGKADGSPLEAPTRDSTPSGAECVDGESPETPGGSGFGPFIRPGMLLVLLLLVIYGNSFEGPFHFDDLGNIVDNLNVQSDRLSFEALSRAVHGRDMGAGAGIDRPVSFLSLALNHAVHGLEPFGYHVVNFSIHALSALLLFLLTFRLLGLTGFGSRQNRGRLIGISLLSAGLWASHPIQVTAVTYIVQRMTALAGLFTLISMYGYVEARTGTGRLRRRGSGIVCLAAGLLAVGSKENAAMLPVTLLLLELFLISGGSRGSRRRLLVLTGGALLAVAAAGLWFSSPASLLSGYQERPFTLGQRLLTEPRVLLFYVSLLLYPVSGRFTLLHDVAPSAGWTDPWTTLPALLLAAALPAAAVLLRKRSPLMAFSLLFFWVNHLVEGTVVPLELVFEHRNYMPSMFFFLPPAMGLAWLAARYPSRHPLMFSAAVLVTIYLFSQGHTVRMRNEHFSHPVLLWRDNAEKAPGLHRPHHNLANAYFAAGMSSEALLEIHRALDARAAARRRQKYITWYNLGTYHLFKGQIEAASKSFDTALRIQPKDPKIYHKIGVVNYIGGRLDVAEGYVLEALRRSRGNPKFLPTLAMIYLKKGDTEAPVRMAVSALKRPDADDHWYFLLGEAFRQKGDLPRARTFYSIFAGREPGQIAPLAALLEIDSLIGQETQQQRTAKRLCGLLKGNEISDVLHEYHLRYNSMGMERIGRIQRAFSQSFCPGPT